MAKAKTFKNALSPAMNFITPSPVDGAEIIEPATSVAAVPKAETRKRRVQLLMQHSLYRAVSSAAAKEGVSVNEFIHQTLEKATKK
jgi:predicted HicB family RNase H-like nuclease